MDSEPRTTGLKRVLGLPLLVFYGVGVTIGAGIFALVGEITRLAGDSAPIAFLTAGFIAALTGFSYAAFASVFPRAAGEAFFVTRAFGNAARAHRGPCDGGDRPALQRRHRAGVRWICGKSFRPAQAAARGRHHRGTRRRRLLRGTRQRHVRGRHHRDRTGRAPRRHHRRFPAACRPAHLRHGSRATERHGLVVGDILRARSSPSSRSSASRTSRTWPRRRSTRTRCCRAPSC